MPERTEPGPHTAGGRVVITGEAVVHKGGRKRAQTETTDRDERPEEKR